MTYIFVGFQADCFVDRHLSKDVSAVRDGLGGADITVTGPHPVFGSRPVSNQFGGCGTRGNGVSLPYTFLELEGVQHGMNEIPKKLGLVKTFSTVFRGYAKLGAFYITVCNICVKFLDWCCKDYKGYGPRIWHIFALQWIAIVSPFDFLAVDIRL